MQHKKAYFLNLTEFGLLSAPINTPIAFVMALTRSDCATRGCIIAAVICGCWAAFVFTPVSDVASNTWPCLMCFHCHLTFLCHSAYTPSRFYSLTSFPHTGDLNDAGRLSSFVSPLAMTTLWVDWTCAQIFFFRNQYADYVRSEPKILIRTDHGSVMIRCTTNQDARRSSVKYKALRFTLS